MPQRVLSTAAALLELRPACSGIIEADAAAMPTDVPPALHTAMEELEATLALGGPGLGPDAAPAIIADATRPCPRGLATVLLRLCVSPAVDLAAAIAPLRLVEPVVEARVGALRAVGDALAAALPRSLSSRGDTRSLEDAQPLVEWAAGVRSGALTPALAFAHSSLSSLLELRSRSAAAPLSAGALRGLPEASARAIVAAKQRVLQACAQLIAASAATGADLGRLGTAAARAWLVLGDEGDLPLALQFELVAALRNFASPAAAAAGGGGGAADLVQSTPPSETRLGVSRSVGPGAAAVAAGARSVCFSVLEWLLKSAVSATHQSKPPAAPRLAPGKSNDDDSVPPPPPGPPSMSTSLSRGISTDSYSGAETLPRLRRTLSASFVGAQAPGDSGSGSGESLFLAKLPLAAGTALQRQVLLAYASALFAAHTGSSSGGDVGGASNAAETLRILGALKAALEGLKQQGRATSGGSLPCGGALFSGALLLLLPESPAVGGRPVPAAVAEAAAALLPDLVAAVDPTDVDAYLRKVVDGRNPAAPLALRRLSLEAAEALSSLVSDSAEARWVAAAAAAARARAGPGDGGVSRSLAAEGAAAATRAAAAALRRSDSVAGSTAGFGGALRALEAAPPGALAVAMLLLALARTLSISVVVQRRGGAPPVKGVLRSCPASFGEAADTAGGAASQGGGAAASSATLQALSTLIADTAALVGGRPVAQAAAPPVARAVRWVAASALVRFQAVATTAAAAAAALTSDDADAASLAAFSRSPCLSLCAAVIVAMGGDAASATSLAALPVAAGSADSVGGGSGDGAGDHVGDVLRLQLLKGGGGGEAGGGDAQLLLPRLCDAHGDGITLAAVLCAECGGGGGSSLFCGPKGSAAASPAAADAPHASSVGLCASCDETVHRLPRARAHTREPVATRPGAAGPPEAPLTVVEPDLALKLSVWGASLTAARERGAGVLKVDPAELPAAAQALCADQPRSPHAAGGAAAAAAPAAMAALCRFCGDKLSTAAQAGGGAAAAGLPDVCSAPACLEVAARTCDGKLPCGHACGSARAPGAPHSEATCGGVPCWEEGCGGGSAAAGPRRLRGDDDCFCCEAAAVGFPRFSSPRHHLPPPPPLLRCPPQTPPYASSRSSSSAAATQCTSAARAGRSARPAPPARRSPSPRRAARSAACGPRSTPPSPTSAAAWHARRQPSSPCSRPSCMTSRTCATASPPPTRPRTSATPPSRSSSRRSSTSTRASAAPSRTLAAATTARSP